MPIVTEQRKKQQKLISVMVLVFIVTGAVLYFGFLRKPSLDRGVVPTDQLPIVPAGPGVITLDLGILEEQRFRELVPYDKLSGDIETGRRNPFLPYVISSVVPREPSFPSIEDFLPPVEDVLPPVEEQAVGEGEDEVSESGI